jgi:hypothetical protein
MQENNNHINYKCPLLCKSKYNRPIETVFIIGNGAIEQGSLPLQKALEEAQNQNLFPFKSALLGDISTLSYTNLVEKEMFDLLILHVKGAMPVLPSAHGRSGFQQCVGTLFCHAIQFRELLAKSYQDLKDCLRIRDTVWPLLLQEGILDPSSASTTTNWDTVLWDHSEIQNILHIHGHCHSSASLILPTDTVGERALRCTLLNEAKDQLNAIAEKENAVELVNQLIDYYDIPNSDSLVAQMYAAENLFIDWLSSTKKIVLCGLRLNDYDHELISILSRHAPKQKCEIVLINIAVDSKEQMEKINKVAGLFSCDPSLIKFLNTHSPAKVEQTKHPETQPSSENSNMV